VSTCRDARLIVFANLACSVCVCGVVSPMSVDSSLVKFGSKAAVMTQFRAYRCVVAGTTGRIGSHLTKQLLMSPLCQEVHALARTPISAFDAVAKSKLRLSKVDFSHAACGLDKSFQSGFEGADAAFCCLGARGGWAAADVTEAERDNVIRFAELCAAANIPHFTLLSSAMASLSSRLQFAKVQAEAVDACAAMRSFKRVSVFQPAIAVNEDGRVLGQFADHPWVSALWRGAPVAAQFLPMRFRQIIVNDITLAMRLNVELCDTAERVEYLGFEDMMKIIGKDDVL